MFYQQQIITSIGNAPDGMQKNATISAVLEFVENYLPEFALEYKYIENEKGLNHYLVLNLAGKAIIKKCIFRFQHENMENPERGDSPFNDFAVYSNSENVYEVEGITYKKDEPFFVFECKILGLKEKLREKEYLIGHIKNKKYILCGGIERYKQEIHGAKLPKAGLIGYVKEKDFETWYKQLNNWIEGFASDVSDNWTASDKLIMQKSNEIIALLTSENSRILNNKPIFLYHLWVNLL